MKTPLITLTFLLLSVSDVLRAQNIKVVTEGIIEYNKTINMDAAMPAMSRNGVVQPSIKKFVVFNSSLSFSNNKTLFTPGAAAASYVQLNPAIAQNNTIYTDLTAGISTTERDIPYGLFLVKDSVRAINWKITDETRDILGYPCRRANAVIMDSIYLVAFFTSDIPVSGGPESISGLPGMILLVSMPHEHMTWEATKVSSVAVPLLKVPTKGKVKTSEEYQALVESALKIPDQGRRQLYLRGLLL